MPMHLSTDEITTKCGVPLGELAMDTYTDDPDAATCPVCDENLGRPYLANSVTEAYALGYTAGNNRAYAEL